MDHQENPLSRRWRKLAIVVLAVIGIIALLIRLGGVYRQIRLQGQANSAVQEVQQVDLDRAIEWGQEYLLRMIDPELHGVHKYYYATEDRFEDRLHTTYTASTAYTMLKAGKKFGDGLLPKKAKSLGEYLLSMQEKNAESRGYGAFHYSYNILKEEKDYKYVVGTASKTTFTLLKLDTLFDDPRYMEAARLAGDWLLTMQRKDGNMNSYIRLKDSGTWSIMDKNSILYNSQSLSALSRLYKATQEEKYLGGADRIAEYLAGIIEKQGCYLGDDYRDPNPISSSWVVLSFLDYSTASGDHAYEETAFRCSDELLKRQHTDTSDLPQYGRWRGAYSSSGNGWIAEVMMEVYAICKEVQRADCSVYRDSVTRAAHWLLKHMYTPENSSGLPNPERARGGFYWSSKEPYVRTDSVCHGLNALIDLSSEL